MKKEEYVLFTTGFAAMGSEMLVIFVFQVLYGYIYLQIGAIITAGLVPNQHGYPVRSRAFWISLEGRFAKLRSQLFDLGAVAEEKISDDGQWLIHVDLSQKDAEQLGRMPGAEGTLVRESILLAAQQTET